MEMGNKQLTRTAGMIIPVCVVGGSGGGGAAELSKMVIACPGRLTTRIT